MFEDVERQRLALTFRAFLSSFLTALLDPLLNQLIEPG